MVMAAVLTVSIESWSQNYLNENERNKIHKQCGIISQDLCEHATLRIIAEMLRLKVSHIKDRLLLSMYLTCLQIFNIIGRQTSAKKANLTLLLSFHVEGDKR